MKNKNNSFEITLRAGFGRRFGALIYDALLLVAWLMLTTLFFLQCSGEKVIPPGNIFFQAYLIFVSFIFFFIFWFLKRQTLGMRAWSLVLQPTQGNKIYVWQFLARFIMAFFSYLFFGLGFLW